MMKKVGYFIFLVFMVSCSGDGCDIENDNRIAMEKLTNFIENQDLYVDELDLSIANFNKVLNCDSLNTYALQYIVIAYLYKKDFSKALLLNEKALLNDSLTSFFITQRGTIYELSGNPDSSRYYFEKSLNIQIELEKKFQDSMEIKFQILDLLDRIGRKDLAKKELEIYMKANPENDILKSIQNRYQD